MEKNKKIHILMTGGTIDSYYNGIKDTSEPLQHSAIPNYINSLKLDEEVIFTEICMKDSRSITQDDRLKLLNEIEKSEETNILISHGTYTMPDTARYLEGNLQRKDQKIILTGSMIPLTGFSPSDGGFNLGFSIASFRNCEPGVYVCMNGILLNASEVVKLLNEGRFTSVFNK